AALAVALFHIFLTSPVRPQMPTALGNVFLQGDLGVAIFFVLSGFVIAHSLDGVAVTPAVFGRFMARRLVRLHPPYVASLVLAVGVVAVSNRVLRDRVLPYPSLDSLVVHFFYLEDALGIPKINDVYWTLCLEVQFYLLFVLLTGLAQRTDRGAAAPGRESVAGRWIFFGLVTLYGCAVAADVGVPDFPGSCLGKWPMFLGGAVVCWLVRGRVPMWIGAVHGAALLTLAVWQQDRMAAAALLTAVALFAGCRHGPAVAWLNHPTMQFLGKISYSLYLVHPFFGQRVANLLGRVAGSSAAASWAVFAGTIVAAVIGAQVFWRFVEVPAINWSKRIRVGAAVRAVPGIATGADSPARLA
ncbi:MAG: hypothetical protein RLZZ15_971, partial [Verrucomicrobiota bacterium]